MRSAKSGIKSQSRAGDPPVAVYMSVDAQTQTPAGDISTLAALKTNYLPIRAFYNEGRDLSGREVVSRAGRKEDEELETCNLGIHHDQTSRSESLLRALEGGR